MKTRFRSGRCAGGLVPSLFVSLAAFFLFTGFEPSDIVYDKCREQQMYRADCSAFAADGAGRAKNVILVIGDGMGIPQTYAGRVYLNGPRQHLEWEDLPGRGLVTTCSIGHVTDSAASGTAMATGHKTANGRISMSESGADRFANVLDLVKGKKAVGIVSTSRIVDATPAVFTTHAALRSMDRMIAKQMVTETTPEVILGGGAINFDQDRNAVLPTNLDREDIVQAARDKGYTVVRTTEEISALDLDSTTRLLGLFAPEQMTLEVMRGQDSREPHLSDMAGVALDVLDNDPRGFFLMVEGGNIDHACHQASMEKLVGEMAEFNRTIELILDWAEEHPGTLVVITGDHETGGMEIQGSEYMKGERVKVKWTTMILPFLVSHSSQRVPVYAAGPNAGAVREQMDNTEVHCVIMNAFGENPDR